MLFAARPARIRMDIVSPFGVALATLTSDGQRFGLADLRDKTFFTGPAAACNIARLTTVPVPGHVLVDLLRGEAPVLKHEGGGATMAWDSHGWWVLAIPGTREATEEIHLAPRPTTGPAHGTSSGCACSTCASCSRVRALPRGAERPRERADRGTARGPGQPRAAHSRRAAPCATPRSRARSTSRCPVPEADVRFTYQQLEWNPPLPEGTFVQPVPQGMRVEPVTCED